MAEFDEVAYNAACELFERAKRIRGALPSLVAQVADSVDMLGAQRYDGAPVSGGGENRVEAAMAALLDEHDALMGRLAESRARYRETAAMCEAAISDMEAHLEGDALDSSMLRYYYMQDMSVPRIARKMRRDKMPYSEAWLYEKKDIALVRVAAAVRRLHYF